MQMPLCSIKKKFFINKKRLISLKNQGLQQESLLLVQLNTGCDWSWDLSVTLLLIALANTSGAPFPVVCSETYTQEAPLKQLKPCIQETTPMY